jgi:hypothetical protein
MYGTVMIGQLRGTADQARQAHVDWLTERAPQITGFVDAGLLIGDDGARVVNWARFVDRAAYAALADDLEQDTWYRQRLEPLLDGPPNWIDGDWADLSSGLT